MGWIQSHFGRSGEERNLQTLPGIKPKFLYRSAYIVVIYRLSYPGSSTGMISVKFDIDYVHEILYKNVFRFESA